MEPIKKIIVCIDLSDYSKANIECALKLRGNTGAEIILLNVLNKRDIDAVEMVSRYYPDKVSVSDYIKTSKRERHDGIRDLVREHFFDEKSSMSIVVTQGIPDQEILKAAEAEDADLIVIGNKGRTNLGKTLFGSVAEKVFRNSPVPVVSVRNKEAFNFT